MNLRIVRLSVKNSTTIEVLFTEKLDTSISSNNIAISAISGSVRDPEIISTNINGTLLTITLRQMVPRANYKVIFSSTTTQSFLSARGNKLIQDGRTNVVFFVGQEEENVVRENIIKDLPDIYEAEAGGLVFDTIDAGAKQILNAAHNTSEIKSANYVSLDATNVAMTRGSGPFDRFPDEGVYQLLRVGTSMANVDEIGNISFSSFPSYPVSLQQILVSKEDVSNTTNNLNGFNGLLITVSNLNVIIVSSIVLIRNNVRYTYDISTYKYGIYDDKYDPINAYSDISLSSNQIRLNASAVGSTFLFPQGSDKFEISYYYKKEGRTIDNVSVYSIEDVVRESIPAVATSFFLNNAPIVNSSGVVPTRGGITWLDPAQNFASGHPAFVTEIAFNASQLPSQIGEYAVNYNTGQVIVYGVNGTGTDGSTTIPPVATYKYKKSFQENIDYTFFSDINEISSLPAKELRGNSGTINFTYTDNFANGIDFDFASHIESVNERVENRLISNIGVYTQKYPVKEVFRIYNETTGELYTPTRISGNEVYFSAINPPRTKDIKRERVAFEIVIQSQLVITDTESSGSFNILTIELEDTDIVSATGSFIGANFNSSLSFSDTDVFVREHYYVPSNTVAQNKTTLSSIGDYIVNYSTGTVYVAVSTTQGTDIGDATYRKNNIKTKNNRITRVDNVYRSRSVSSDNTETFTIGAIGINTINITDLENVGETTNSGGVITVSNDTITVSSDAFRLNGIYQVTDLQTRYDPIDFSVGATINNSTRTQISLDSDGVIIEDDDLTIQAAGTRKYVEANRIDALFTAGLAELASAIGVFSSNTNFYLNGSDGYVEASTNRIYLPSTTSLSVGQSVNAKYRVLLRNSAAVLVDYTTGDLFTDYTYSQDEILITYEYGDNVLDWSISSSLNEGDTYYVSYKYGALRNALRDNFGVLTGLEELSNIPDDLDRETYRSAVSGSLQTFTKGPIIPALKQLVESFTQITPNITESVFEEWVLGRDYLDLQEIKTQGSPTYSEGKFGKGLLLNSNNQTAILPAISNIRFEEGTWEAFITPEWNGIENDATLTFDLQLDGRDINLSQIYIGAEANNPSSIPFALNSNSSEVLGRPYNLHGQGVSGYFIWFDADNDKWRVRVRAPISENRLFSGNINTNGGFYNVKIASTADGYDGYDGYEIDEINDKLWSTSENVNFSFVVDAYDMMNMAFDAYDAYGVGSIAGFDGIDFVSNKLHYFFDTGFSNNQCRMSLLKDGDGFIKYRVYDDNKRRRELSYNAQLWEAGDTHHLAVSWKMGTTEQRDELHLFIDGEEVENTYRFGGYLDIPIGNNKNTYPFLNYLNVPSGTKYLDPAKEILTTAATAPTIGGSDLRTTAGSNTVSSLNSDFSTVVVGSKFEILDDTADGLDTQTNSVVVSSVVDTHTLELESGSVDWNASLTLANVNFSVNPLVLQTVSDPSIEKVRVFANDTELNPPGASGFADYGFTTDGYMDFVEVYNGVDIGEIVSLKTFGMNIQRCIQYAYNWPDLQTNILKYKIPAPTSISKININSVIVKRTTIEVGAFAVLATLVGGHLISVLSSSLDFCSPSNTVNGRTLTISVSGDNFDWTGINSVFIIGNTTDGYNFEQIDFTAPEKTTTSRYFTTIDDIIASFTPLVSTIPAGSIEITETYPINWSQNSGDYAEIHLSVQEQTGTNGTVVNGVLSDSYARFGTEDIGKKIYITSPIGISDIYEITDVPYDVNNTAKDSNSVELSGIPAGSYSNVEWKQINTYYGDSGFANGLITLETFGSGGSPFLLRNCWYKIDSPAYLVLPWNHMPDYLYIGSDRNGSNQVSAVIDEMRILDELSLDTRAGETLPSSGRSITTDAQSTVEFEINNQTLGLFHFNESLDNSAKFIRNYAKSYRQSENSVNSNFGQSGVFTDNGLKIDNKAIFRNNGGTIEFWVSPILDTYNDPSVRYYIDLSTELITEVISTTATVINLPQQARSISSITIEGSDINYFAGSTLGTDGTTITLSRELPTSNINTTITYTPITVQGDRFRVFKNETGALVFLITASDIDYQISTPIFWKKNSWHRIVIGWNLNNTNNQDTMYLMVDGAEAGTIRYGTGFLYGSGTKYGQKTIWGSATVGTTAARNILADINLLDTFNYIYVGSDFANKNTALAKFDNMRFSNEPRSVIYLGATTPDTIVGAGPGRLIKQDLLYTSNINTANPVISDALTGLLLDFNTTAEEIEYIAQIRDAATGIFDFSVEVIDTFELANTTLIQQLITNLINRLKPSHTRASVSFTK